MKTAPKNFYCEECGKEFYTHKNYCTLCHGEDNIKPIPKEYYKCYLNGSFYGGGNLEYMSELFNDYVVACGMYGRKEVEFKIVRDECWKEGGD